MLTRARIINIAILLQRDLHHLVFFLHGECANRFSNRQVVTFVLKSAGGTAQMDTFLNLKMG